LIGRNSRGGEYAEYSEFTVKTRHYDIKWLHREFCPPGNQSPIKISGHFLESPNRRGYALPKSHFALQEIEKYDRKPDQT